MPGIRILTISISRSIAGWSIQWKSALRFKRVVQLARAVGGQDHSRLATRADGADLGNRDLKVREHLEQERLELLVGPVDLVDQENDGLVAVDRLEQRPADQELGPEQLVLGHRSLLRRADVQQLARVVPLVDGVRDVEAFVALEPDQARAGRRRERLGGLGLADTCLSLEQQRLLERERQEQGGRKAAVRQVVRFPERDLELVDRAEPAHRLRVDERAASRGVEPGSRRRLRAARPPARPIARGSRARRAR